MINENDDIEIRKAFHDVAGQLNNLLFHLGSLVVQMENDHNFKSMEDLLKDLREIEQKGGKSSEAFKDLKRKVYGALKVENKKPIKEGEA